MTFEENNGLFIPSPEAAAEICRLAKEQVRLAREQPWQTQEIARLSYEIGRLMGAKGPEALAWSVHRSPIRKHTEYKPVKFSKL